MQSGCCKASQVLRDLHHWAPKFGLSCQVDWFFLRTRTPKKKYFGSKKWGRCWRAEVILWQYLYGSVLFHFFHAGPKVEPIYWVEAVHVHHSGSKNEKADKVSFSSFHTRMIRCVWSMRWSYLAAIFRFCKCSRSGVRRCGEPYQGIQVDLYIKDYKGKGCRKFDIICSGMLLWLEAVIKNRYFASICTYWYWQKYLTDVNAKPREMIRGIDWKVTVDGVIPKSYSSKGP